MKNNLFGKKKTTQPVNLHTKYYSTNPCSTRRSSPCIVHYNAMKYESVGFYCFEWLSLQIMFRGVLFSRCLHCAPRVYDYDDVIKMHHRRDTKNMLIILVLLSMRKNLNLEKITWALSIDLPLQRVVLMFIWAYHYGFVFFFLSLSLLLSQVIVLSENMIIMEGNSFADIE